MISINIMIMVMMMVVMIMLVIFRMVMIIMIIMNNILFITWIEPGDALAIRTFAAQQGTLL